MQCDRGQSSVVSGKHITTILCAVAKTPDSSLVWTFPNPDANPRGSIADDAHTPQVNPTPRLPCHHYGRCTIENSKQTVQKKIRITTRAILEHHTAFRTMLDRKCQRQPSAKQLNKSRFSHFVISRKTHVTVLLICFMIRIVSPQILRYLFCLFHMS